MSTTTDTYSNRVGQAQDTMMGSAAARMRGAKALMNMVPTPGNGLLSPTDAIQQYGRVTKRLVEVNVEYMRDLAGAVRKHVTGLAGVLKDEVVTSARVANNQAEKLEEAAIEQAEELQRVERAEARRAKRAAREAAAERYQDMTKAELSDELAKRDMTKSGNVDELRERLVESDLQTS